MRSRPVLLVLAWVVALLSWAAPASAHVNLVDSNPDDGAVLASSPEEVTLTFAAAVEAVPGGVRFFDARGERIEVDDHISGAVLTVDVPDDLEQGTYVLGWRVVSVDGHPIAGVLTFSVGEPSARVVQPDLGATDRAWLTTLLSVADAATYLGLLVAAGAALCALWVVPAGAGARARSRLALLVTRAASLGAVAAVLRVPLVTLDQQGLAAADLMSPAPWVDAPDEVLIGAALLLVGLGLVQAAVSSRAGERLRRAVVVSGAVLALSAPTATGHTRSLDPPALVALVDGWHLLAASVWVGGLLLMVVVWPSLGSLQRVRALSRFSTLAAGVLVVLVPSGALMGMRILETQESLTSTSYGRLLLVKVSFVALAVAIAVVNRRFLRQAEAGSGSGQVGGVRRRTLVLEVGVLTGVAVLTGALVNQSPRPAPPEPRAVGGVSAVAVLADELEALVSLSPGAVGANEVRIVLRDGSGNAVELSTPPELAFSGPEGRTVDDVPLLLGEDGAFTGEVDLPAPGEWRVEVGQRLDEFTQPVEVLEFLVE